MPAPSEIEKLIRNALIEDLDGKTDITTETIIPPDKEARATLRARQSGIVAGVDVAALVFEIVDPALTFTAFTKDGEMLTAGQNILSVEGPAISILTAERTALNFLAHLSGIATLTGKYVEAIQGTNAKILDTRKTLPGLRELQKKAVKAGGGKNHRFGLYDMVLIKDNHIAIAGNVTAALDKVQNQKTKIEIEVDTLEQLQEALNHGSVDIVMLDNMDPDTLKKAVEMVEGKISTEASGSISLDNIRAIAETGVDYISIGALTHSAPALDIGLDIDV